MRIAIVYLGRRGSGGPISLSMAEALAKYAEVMAVVSEYSESLEAWKAAKIPLVVTPTYRDIFGAVREWIHPARTRALSQEIRRWKPDIVLFPMFYTWNVQVQRLAREIPSVVCVHDPVPHPGLGGFVFGLLERWSMRLATRVIIFSQVFLTVLEQKGFDTSKIDVVPHGDLSYYQRFQGDFPGRRSTPSPDTLLFFGRITAYKGLDVLLRACKVVQEKRSMNLIIAGSGNLRPYQGYLKRLESVEIENKWLGERDIPEVFRRAGIVVLPYTSGSQSGVLAVAASFGAAVIASSTGGIVEQLENNVTGLLVEPGSVDELSDAILRLLDNPALARKLGDNLRKKYAEQYNWDQIGKMILEICQKAL